MFSSNNNLRSPATKKDLLSTEKRILSTTKKWLKSFATKKDLENFATKKDLENLESRMATKFDLQDLEARMEERFVTNERFDLALGKLDYIIGEIKASREEDAAQYLQHEDIKKRLTRIEQIPIITNALKI